MLFARDPDDESLWWGTKSHERGVSEVVNDIDGELMNFWECLQNASATRVMQRTLEATPFSEMSYHSAIQTFDCPPGSMAPADRAIAFFIRYRQSRQGLAKDFATLSRNRTRRGMNEQASAWLTAVEGLPEIHKRLRGVVILNRDAMDVIRQQDGEKTLFYLDPPYLHETRTAKDAYRHEMTETQHFDLLKLLSCISGKFMLSGYRSPMYDADAKRFGWRRVDFDLPNHASGAKTKERKTECVWMNFEPAL